MMANTIVGENQPKSIVAITEQLVKLSGVLAVFGYMSMRAHLNRLGVSLTGPLGAERYLAEAYAVSYDFALALIGLLGGLCITGFVVACCTVPLWLAVRRRLWFESAAHSFRESGLRVMMSAWVPAAGSIVLFVYILVSNSELPSYGQGVVVGALPSHLVSAPPAPWLRFRAMIAICLSALLISRIAIREFATKRRGGFEVSRYYLWRLVYLAGIFATLQLPLFHGVSIHSTRYTKVGLYTEPGESMCGLLVLQTSGDFRVWHLIGTTGSLAIVPSGRILSMVSGGLADLLQAAREAGNGEKVDLCPDSFLPSSQNKAKSK